MEDLQFSAYGVLLIPIIAGLVEAVKRAGMPIRWTPIVSVALGLGLGVAFLSNGDYKQGILLGVIMGLTSIGIFSGVKNTAQAFQDRAKVPDAWELPFPEELPEGYAGWLMWTSTNRANPLIRAYIDGNISKDEFTKWSETITVSYKAVAGEDLPPGYFFVPSA